MEHFINPADFASKREAVSHLTSAEAEIVRARIVVREVLEHDRALAGIDREVVVGDRDDQSMGSLYRVATIAFPRRSFGSMPSCLQSKNVRLLYDCGRTRSFLHGAAETHVVPGYATNNV